VRFFRPVPRVSLAQTADAQPLARLFAEVWHPWAGVLDQRFIDDQLVSPEDVGVWLTGGFELYRATHEGRLVGAVRLSFPTGTCLLDRLVVAPDSRRRGFGQILAEHSVSRAKRAGASRVWVLLSPRLEAAAGLFRSLGFRETSRFQADYWGEEVTLFELGV
jgi:ribosomal protein S18 acetylase RimI-like enzyme